MDRAEFGRALQLRARELGLADAEVARRLNLSQSRYANYITGFRQPDFETFLKICRVLDTTPDALLGIRPRTTETEDDILVQRIHAAAQVLDTAALQTAAIVLDALAKTHGKAV